MHLYKNGIRHIVTVDDYIPCSTKGEPIFTRPKDNCYELWAMILEKAYAKLHGSYWALNGGLPYEALIDLTGKPTDHYDLKDPTIVKLVDSGEFFKIVKRAADASFIVCGETPGDGTEQSVDSETGLIPGQAYSIVQVKQSKEGDMLLELRNPWGKPGWKGAFNDNDEAWTQSLKDQLNPRFGGNEGLFWMQFEDFCEHFSGVSICKQRKSTDPNKQYLPDEIRIKGEFIKEI